MKCITQEQKVQTDFRVSIPREAVNKLGIEVGDPVSIYLEEGKAERTICIKFPVSTDKAPQPLEKYYKMLSAVYGCDVYILKRTANDALPKVWASSYEAEPLPDDVLSSVNMLTHLEESVGIFYNSKSERCKYVSIASELCDVPTMCYVVMMDSRRSSRFNHVLAAAAARTSAMILSGEVFDYSGSDNL